MSCCKKHKLWNKVGWNFGTVGSKWCLGDAIYLKKILRLGYLLHFSVPATANHECIVIFVKSYIMGQIWLPVQGQSWQMTAKRKQWMFPKSLRVYSNPGKIWCRSGVFRHEDDNEARRSPDESSRLIVTPSHEDRDKLKEKLAQLDNSTYPLTGTSLELILTNGRSQTAVYSCVLILSQVFVLVKKRYYHHI